MEYLRVIIDQLKSLQALRIVVDLGLRFPLYNNAPGKLAAGERITRAIEVAG